MALVLAVFVDPATGARAAVDVSGLWRAEYIIGTPAGSCLLTVTQVDTALSVTGTCDAGTLTASGTIDPATGQFTMSAQVPVCGKVSLSGTATPDANSFTGTFTCHLGGASGSMTVTIVISRCGNGLIDPGEQCDDNNLHDGDCCSSLCRFEPSGSSCGTDHDACTDDVCDGAGACRHPNNTAPCGDGNGCTVGDRCDGAGMCMPGPAAPCDTSAYLIKAFPGIAVGNAANLDGTLFFTAGTSSNPAAMRLWRSDGTEAGTVMVTDHAPDYPGGLSPLANLEGKIVFKDGPELWATNGSDTVALGRFEELRNPTRAGNKLFFLSGGLWRTDGTPAGTVGVRGDFESGFIEALSAVGTTLFFGTVEALTGDPFHSREFRSLWKTDGTLVDFLGGTLMPRDSKPFRMLGVSGTLFFAIGDQLYKSNGTIAGTKLLRQFVSPPHGPSIGLLAPLNGFLIFAGFEDSTEDRELWRSDGTPEGTVRLKDIHPGPEGSALTDGRVPGEFAIADGTLFFDAADDDSRCAHQLWRTDGTPAGTVRVKAFPTLVDPDASCQKPGRLTSAGGLLFFYAFDGTCTRYWRSDGTADGTLSIGDVIFDLGDVNGALLFGRPTPGAGELWGLRRCRAGETCLPLPALPGFLRCEAGPPGPDRCDDGDGCTVDTLSPDGCQHDRIDLAMARMSLAEGLTVDACTDQRVPSRTRRAVQQAATLLGRAQSAARAPAKRRLVRGAIRELDRGQLALRRARRRLTGDCQTALAGRLDGARSSVKCVLSTL